MICISPEGNETIEATVEPANATNQELSEIGNVTYTGKEMKPEVKVESNGKTLTVLEDYSIVFSNNVNAGTAMVYIIGKGNYTGTKTYSFKIVATSQPSPAVTKAPTPIITKAPTNAPEKVTAPAKPKIKSVKKC